MKRSSSLCGLFLLAIVPGFAVPYTVTTSGTFLGSAPTGTFTAPNQTFSLSFLVDSNPVPFDSDPFQFGTQISSLTYLRNGSLDATNGTDAFFFADSGGGGLVLRIAPGFVVDLRTPQLFSLPTSTPTILPGSYAISCGQFGVEPISADCTSMIASGSSLNVEAAGVPEPGTVGLGLIGLVGMWAWRRRVN